MSFVTTSGECHCHVICHYWWTVSDCHVICHYWSTVSDCDEIVSDPMQDVFQVAELSKQGRLFPRTSRRHVFLFEKVVVLSKLQEVASSQQDGRRVSQEGRRAQKEAYFYKAHIPVRGAGPKWWV